MNCASARGGALESGRPVLPQRSADGVTTRQISVRRNCPRYPAVQLPPLASFCAARQPCGAKLFADAEAAQRVSVEPWPAQTCLPAPAVAAEPLPGQAPPVCWRRPLGQALARQHGHTSAAHQAFCESSAAHPDTSGGGLPAVLLGLHAHASRCGCDWWVVHLTCAAWGQALPPAADETTQTHF